jgi:hypothetical protein
VAKRLSLDSAMLKPMKSAFPLQETMVKKFISLRFACQS